MEISRLDKNFRTVLPDENGFLFRDVTLEPFAVEGLPWFQENNHEWNRLPNSFTANDVPEEILILSKHTSGVCVRFQTDSAQLMLRARLSNGCWLSHMPFAASCGFDSYRKLAAENLLYNHTVQPAYQQQDLNALLGVNPEKQLSEWCIQFPMYCGVEKVEIGLLEGSTLLPPKPHRIKNPILFYGASITQGACASRPGNNYATMLCRELDAEQINLGFSGNGKGDFAIAEEIGKLKLSMLIYNYDVPGTEKPELPAKTFFSIIRKAQPELPVIMLPKWYYGRRRIITSHNDVAHAMRCLGIEPNDQNVWFIDKAAIFGYDMYDACTVDGTHPNDLGFYRMYKQMLPTLQQILDKNKTSGGGE